MDSHKVISLRLLAADHKLIKTHADKRRTTVTQFIISAVLTHIEDTTPKQTAAEKRYESTRPWRKVLLSKGWNAEYLDSLTREEEDNLNRVWPAHKSGRRALTSNEFLDWENRNVPGYITQAEQEARFNARREAERIAGDDIDGIDFGD